MPPAPPPPPGSLRGAAGRTATSLAEAARLRPEDVGALRLPPNAKDLTCANMLCGNLGGACACRLARAVEKLPNLEEIHVAGNKLVALPEGVYTHASLRYVNARGNCLGDGVREELATWQRRRKRGRDGPSPVEVVVDRLRASTLVRIDLRDNGFDGATHEALAKAADELRGRVEIIL